MNIRNQIIEPNCFYHIYNRGINSAPIFINQENYYFFLIKFSKYLDPICDVYAYCLMPNHFHFLIKIKSETDLEAFAKQELKIKTETKKGLHSFENVFSKQFAKFISSYSQAFNKVSNRHGSLIESPFKRIKIESEGYLKNLIIYIHQNPSSLKVDFKTYKFSSFGAMLSNKNTKIKRKEVIEFFQDNQNYIFCHDKELNFNEKFITI